MENRKTLISIEVLLFLVLGLATIILHQYYRPSKKKTRHPLPPGPRGLPIVGCLPQMLRNKPAFRWIHKLMQDMNTEIACIRLGGIHLIPVTSPELSREFLKKQDAVFASRPDYMSSKLTSNEYLMGGLSSDVSDQWKKMRRTLVAEVLSPAMHGWLHNKRCEEADHIVRYVYKQCTNPLTNGLVNVRFVGRHYSGNLLRKLIFGKRFFGSGMADGGPGVEEIEHVDGVFTTIDHVYGFPVADFIPFLEVFDLDGRRKSQLDAIKKMRKYQDPEVTKRVEMWKQGVRTTKEDILDVLINLRDSKNNPLLSFQEIRVEIEMMLGTIDNPPNSAEWCIAEMINQPEILEKACKELDRVVGRNRLVNESDLSELNYLKACIKEAFRLHPLAPFNLPHVSTKDAIVGDYFIPKGSHVLLSRTGLGRNPRVWEEPLKYKPERHIINETSEVLLSDPELRLLSFSTGRRGCPGIVLGSAITTILLARLIQAFDWSASRVDLVESESGLLMANPLIARASPRLKPDVYMQLLV